MQRASTSLLIATCLCTVAVCEEEVLALGRTQSEWIARLNTEYPEDTVNACKVLRRYPNVCRAQASELVKAFVASKHNERHEIIDVMRETKCKLSFDDLLKLIRAGGGRETSLLLHDHSSDAFPALVAALQDEKKETRFLAMTVLQQSRLPCEEAKQILVKAMGDADPETKMQALTTVVKMWPYTDACMIVGPFVKQNLNDESIRVRRHALDVVSEIYSTNEAREIVRPILNQWMSSDSAEVRREALTRIGTVYDPKEATEVARPFLIKWMSADSAEVRQEALARIGTFLGPKEACELIAQKLETETKREIQDEYLDAFASITRDHNAAIETLRGFWVKSKDVDLKSKITKRIARIAERTIGKFGLQTMLMDSDDLLKQVLEHYRWYGYEEPKPGR